MNLRQFAFVLHALALAILFLVLAFAFVDQIFSDELPCPLCLLQRGGFIAAGLGLMLNLRFGTRSAHYGVTLLGALVGIAASIRQILLHIAPGDPGYGAPLMGLHLYSWSFICFACLLFATSMLLLLPAWTRDQQGAGDVHRLPASTPLQRRLTKTLIWLLTVLIAANVLSTLLECGFSACLDDPVRYRGLPLGL